MKPKSPAPILDGYLLDLATVIELSDNDRKIADRRYGQLKQHLERPSSPLRQLLLSESGLIYAQGSMAIGSTIVSGVDDDRFDVDALVDVRIPNGWSDSAVLDILEEALQGFPGVREIVRCTRCVQLRFAFMHMDVTILDPARGPRQERVGEIFHSPDNAPAHRVPANPYGFSLWFRAYVSVEAERFAQEVRKRRATFAMDRLTIADTFTKTEQEDLPPVIPPRLDLQQVVSLKLMKRVVNISYHNKNLKRPPSIYLTKLAATCGFDPNGLTSQLERFAEHISKAMATAYSDNKGPDERNPSFERDKLNDRWPKTQEDRQALHNVMQHLLASLEKARSASIGEIKDILKDLFGEKVATKTYDRIAAQKPTHVMPGSGSLIGALSFPSPTSRAAPIPPHKFHCGEIRKKR